jgi:ferredoxin
MATRISYFSSTGNSLHAARRLAEGLGAEAPRSVVGAGAEGCAAAEAGGGDAVGLVFPVYLHGLPRPLLEFARRARFGAATYVFAVATNNGETGDCMASLDAALRRSGARASARASARAGLSAGFGLLMPGNSVIIEDFTNCLEERGRRLESAELALRDIIKRVAAREVNRYGRSESFGSWIKSRAIRGALRSYGLPRRFGAGPSCTGCGTCARACPAANVVLEGGRPSWGGDCVLCLGCYHACPRRAIDIDDYTKDRQIGRAHV